MKTWNISHLQQDDHVALLRTNNALERYNRRLNDKFRTPHPALPKFITTLEEESRYQVQHQNDARRGIVVAPTTTQSELQEIPEFYSRLRDRIFNGQN